MLTTIRHMKINPVARLVEDADRYAYRPDRPHRWLQRACIGILRRLGAVAQVTEHTYTTTTFDTQRLTDSILAKRRDVLDHVATSPERLRVVMGVDEFEELSHEQWRGQSAYPVAFDATARYMDGLAPRRAGMRIQVVPWVKGLVVIPDDRPTT